MLLLGVGTAELFTECPADADLNKGLSPGIGPELTAGIPHARHMVAYRANVPPAHNMVVDRQC